jgi:Membrane carboxypeptidase (penicillin-binding protein)
MDLSLNEAATIAGLIRGPNYYSPHIHKERCRKRRNMVLNAMHQKGWISDEELKTVLPLPIKTVGYGAYGKIAPYFIDYLSDQLKELYSPQDLSSLGLSIYTTLDTQVQMAAEKALKRGLERLEKSNPSLVRKEPGKDCKGPSSSCNPKQDTSWPWWAGATTV